VIRRKSFQSLSKRKIRGEANPSLFTSFHQVNLDTAGEVLVMVQDSGIAVDMEHAERLFNAFFATKASGAGMGLSISRAMIVGGTPAI